MMWRVLFSLLFLVVFALPASAFELGETVVLDAQNPLGIPLHSRAEASLAGRAADGTRATIREIVDGGRWHRLELEDGRTAWVVERYLTPSIPGESQTPRPTQPPAQLSAASVWRSGDDCKARLASGERLAKPEGTVRLASWNIRWFPRGKPEADEIATDLGWVACALAWMQVDAVAVQEIQDDRLAQLAAAVLFDELATLGGGEWTMEVQDCGGEGVQHVGWLWNKSRVALAQAADTWQLNGAANEPDEPCAGNLRPGRSAYLTSMEGKLDAHVVVVHSDSGTSERDFDHRQAGLRRLDQVFADLHARQPDSDMVVLGDFNTMGAQGRASAEEEIALLKRTVSEEAPGFTMAEPQLACTEYFEGECSWLDHVLVSNSMAEGEGAKARVEGYCAELGGAPIQGTPPLAYQQLSDHCPVLVDLRDTDDD